MRWAGGSISRSGRGSPQRRKTPFRERTKCPPPKPPTPPPNPPPRPRHRCPWSPPRPSAHPTRPPRAAQLPGEGGIKDTLPLALAARQDGTTVLPRSTAAAEDFTGGRERFVAEGRTLASLQNAPAIVRVFDFLEANGTAYIVMQLLHGETLESRLKRTGPLKSAEIDRILWPLLDGLEQVHNAGFLHRAIKPANS